MHNRKITAPKQSCTFSFNVGLGRCLLTLKTLAPVQGVPYLFRLGYLKLARGFSGVLSPFNKLSPHQQFISSQNQNPLGNSVEIVWNEEAWLQFVPQSQQVTTVLNEASTHWAVAGTPAFEVLCQLWSCTRDFLQGGGGKKDRYLPGAAGMGKIII